jgi:hypothetical protein
MNPNSHIDILKISAIISYNLCLPNNIDLVSFIISRVIEIFETKNPFLLEDGNKILSNLISNVRMQMDRNTKEMVIL